MSDFAILAADEPQPRGPGGLYGPKQQSRAEIMLSLDNDPETSREQPDLHTSAHDARLSRIALTALRRLMLDEYPSVAAINLIAVPVDGSADHHIPSHAVDHLGDTVWAADRQNAEPNSITHRVARYVALVKTVDETSDGRPVIQLRPTMLRAA